MIVRCPECNGKGKIHDVAGGLFTLGLMTFWECVDDDFKITCPRCNGSGFLKVE